MKKQLRRVLSILLLSVLVSCSGSQPITQSDTDRIKTLGKQFEDQLNQDIIYFKDSEDRLRELNAVLVTEAKTYNVERFRAFHTSYEAGESAELLTIFKTKAFVATKLVCEEGRTYYFRYEFDPFDEDAIVITSQMVDEITVTEDEKLKKLEYTLLRKKQTPIVVSYKNIQEDAAQSSD